MAIRPASAGLPRHQSAADMGLLPSGWTTTSSIGCVDVPVSSRRPSSDELPRRNARSVPRDRGVQHLQAGAVDGRERARLRRHTPNKVRDGSALSDQAIRPSLSESLGANVTSPDLRLRTRDPVGQVVDHTQQQARRRTLARESSRWPAVSTAPIGWVSCPKMSPASSSGTSWKTLAPVRSSPAMIARWTGAAPRQRGSSEKCRFIQPSRGAESSGSRTRPPYATITPRSGAIAVTASVASPDRRLAFRSLRPSSSAARATGVGVRMPRRPTGESSRVMTAGNRVWTCRQRSKARHRRGRAAGEDEVQCRPPVHSHRPLSNGSTSSIRTRRPTGGAPAALDASVRLRAVAQRMTSARRSPATAAPEP